MRANGSFWLLMIFASTRKNETAEETDHDHRMKDHVHVPDIQYHAQENLKRLSKRSIN